MDFVHLTANFLTPAQLRETVVARLAARLSAYTLRSRLYVMPYTHFDLALPGGRSGLEVVLFRRFLLRLAELLAARLGAQALVTGDSLGQVASQTMENLAAASVVHVPLLRPLIGFNKPDIIAVARAIGTYPDSIRPYKDCCSLLARSPQTMPSVMQVEAAERELLPDWQPLIERTLADCFVLQYACGRELPDGEPG